jgi:hypothetical protein
VNIIFRNIVFVCISLLLCTSVQAQGGRYTLNFDSWPLPQFFDWASTGGGSGAQMAGSTGFSGALVFTYQNTPLTNPAATPKSGTRVLQANTNTAVSGTSRVIYGGPLDLTKGCTNAQFVVGFWMYRSGTDANADRINVLMNTAPVLAGATNLITVNRSRALSPTVYGTDGWYRYEALVPMAFNGSTNYLFFEVIDASAGATGNIYIDDIEYMDNAWDAINNVDGGSVNAGPNVTICSGGSAVIGAVSTPNTTYSWAPATGLSSTVSSNPTVTLVTAGVTNYTVTSTTTGPGCTSVNSDVVTVTVSASQAPVITSATSTSICSGTALSFPFSATNSPTGYIWLASDNALTTGESYTTTTNSATLNDVITSSINQPVTYSVSAYTAACPSNNQIQTFTVNVVGPASATDPSFTTVCNGGTAVFTTTASGTGPFTYQWQQNNVNIGGATSSTYSYPGVTPAMNGFTYRCIVTGACAPSYTTANATLTVSSSLTTTTPGNQTVCQGANAFFSTTTVGTPPFTYQWQEDNGGGYANISNGGVYSGATSSNLMLTSPPVGMNSYRYKCNVTDACGSISSGPAQLFVNAAISYASATATQPITSSVSKCAANQEIILMNVVVNAGTCPSTPSVTNLGITMNGTSFPLAGMVSNVQVYYTGSSSSFSPVTQFGVDNAPSVNINIAGSQTLSAGNNYFWLVYDMNPNSTGATVDATWTSVDITGGANPGTYVPTVTDPGSGRSVTSCISPGGVINGLTYWLKSNDGGNVQSTIHDAPIGLWGSSFSNNYDLQQSVGVKKPLFKNYTYDTTFNFNPYLAFDGTNDILQSTSLLGQGLLADDGLALLVCATESAPNNNAAFGYKEGDSGPFYQINPENNMLLFNSAGKKTEIFLTDFTQPATDFPMAKVVGIKGNSSGSPDFAEFIRNSEILPSTSNSIADAEDGLSIGGNGDALSHGNTKIAEVITYNVELTSTEIQQIQSYVGVKYGIHMEQDYLASDGSTKIWDYSSNTSYNFDIAGIGRDDKSGLYQKQSQSVNTDEILTVGLTSISSANAANTETFDSDKSFLLWGNNDEITVSDYSTLAPTATPFLPAGIQGRIKRVWKFEGTNFNGNTFNRLSTFESTEKVVATKTLTLGFDAHILAGSFVAGPNNTIKVLVDDDGVDWSNAVVVSGAVVVGTTTSSGLRILVPSVTVEPGKNFVTLATTDASMLPLASEITHFSAECKSTYNSVKWITASEIDVDDFTLQRSSDAVHFFDVYTISGKGNHGVQNIYSYEDLNPQGKNFYYRIKQKTNNGNYIYSRTITTDNSCKYNSNSQLNLSVSPNPVTENDLAVDFIFSGARVGKGFVDVKSVTGLTIDRILVEVTDEKGSLFIKTNQLKPGIYFIEMSDGNQTKTVKFIKE